MGPDPYYATTWSRYSYTRKHVLGKDGGLQLIVTNTQTTLHDCVLFTVFEDCDKYANTFCVTVAAIGACTKNHLRRKILCLWVSRKILFKCK